MEIPISYLQKVTKWWFLICSQQLSTWDHIFLKLFLVVDFVIWYILPLVHPKMFILCNGFDKKILTNPTKSSFLLWISSNLIPMVFSYLDISYCLILAIKNKIKNNFPTSVHTLALYSKYKKSALKKATILNYPMLLSIFGTHQKVWVSVKFWKIILFLKYKKNQGEKTVHTSNFVF